MTTIDQVEATVPDDWTECIISDEDIDDAVDAVDADGQEEETIEEKIIDDKTSKNKYKNDSNDEDEDEGDKEVEETERTVDETERTLEEDNNEVAAAATLEEDDDDDSSKIQDGEEEVNDNDEDANVKSDTMTFTTASSTNSSDAVTITTTISVLSRHVDGAFDHEGVLQREIKSHLDQISARYGMPTSHDSQWPSPSFWMRLAVTGFAIFSLGAFTGFMTRQFTLPTPSTLPIVNEILLNETESITVPIPIVSSAKVKTSCIADPVTAKAKRTMMAQMNDDMKGGGRGEINNDDKKKVEKPSDNFQKKSPVDELDTMLYTIQSSRHNVPTIHDKYGNDISPQTKARNWMILQKINGEFDISNDNDGDEIAQRYALAVFFYALGGEEWDENLGFLSPRHVCEWNGRIDTDFWSGYDQDGDEDNDLNEMDEEDLMEQQYDDWEDDYRYAKAGVFCNGQKQVTSLKFSHDMDFYGSIPPEIDLLSHLEIIDIDDQLSEGPLITELGRLTNLRRLMIRNSGISGTIPTELAQLTKLEKLYLDGNKIWGRIPNTLGGRTLTKLSSMRLANNRLTGSIPLSFGLHSELEELDVSNNKISGSIPSRMFSMLSKMRHLDLSKNELTGQIPTEIGMMNRNKNHDITNLVIMLDSNNLSGSIPTELGNLESSLEQLYLNDNQLQGSLPSELSRLSLMTLHLHNNGLTGTVPTELSNMTWLFYFDVSGNYFVGSLDEILCDSNGTAGDFHDVKKFVADCGKATYNSPSPGIVCSCCTTCCVGGMECDKE